MRAVSFDRYGDASVLSLGEVAAPVARAGEVLVRVTVASLNPVDGKLRGGMARLIRRPRLPAITGCDFAGTVAALGAGVTGFTVGQRVFGSTDPLRGQGACAELVAVPTRLVAPTPAALTDEVAACLPIAAGTAVQALEHHAHLTRGQTVLVTGASGAVGAAAVQLARSIGATITGVCGTANVAYVAGLGADHVVDYRTTDWRTLGATYDVIFDAAGASSLGAARPHLARAGVYLHTSPRAGLFLAAPLVRLFSSQRAVPLLLKKDAALLTRLAALAVEGVLRPHLAQTVDLAGVADAQRAIEAGKVHGKIVVRVQA
jgi:NADPH:quinone reductase-like Zn-dependent oxidoreductase